MSTRGSVSPISWLQSPAWSLCPFLDCNIEAWILCFPSCFWAQCFITVMEALTKKSCSSVGTRFNMTLPTGIRTLWCEMDLFLWGAEQGPLWTGPHKQGAGWRLGVEFLSRQPPRPVYFKDLAWALARSPNTGRWTWWEVTEESYTKWPFALV